MTQDNFSRREFLGISAAAAGGTLAGKTILLTPEPLQAATRLVAASDRVRFGMIGVGMQGSGLLGVAHRGRWCGDGRCGEEEWPHRADRLAAAALVTTVGMQ